MLNIRPIQKPDIAAVLKMIHALAAHHGDQATLTHASLERLTFGAQPWVWLQVAEQAAVLVGYAALCPKIQLVYARKGIDMQHLFVVPKLRGQGIGRALIAACEAHARVQQAQVMTVGTHPDNTTAGDVYRAVGFEGIPSPGPRFAKGL